MTPVIAGSINAPQAHKSNPYRPAPNVRYVLSFSDFSGGKMVFEINVSPKEVKIWTSRYSFLCHGRKPVGIYIEIFGFQGLHTLHGKTGMSIKL
jgi:hypothetical protein